MGGVEKACLSAIHQLEIERDPSIKGEDWDNLNQPFTHCTSKLLNYFENTRAKRKDWGRKLLTAMFVTDFGLFIGLKKVPCDKDERLLENYLHKIGIRKRKAKPSPEPRPSNTLSSRDSRTSSRSRKTLPAPSQRELSLPPLESKPKKAVTKGWRSIFWPLALV